MHSLKQNGSSIADYYHNLNAMWKQFDAMIELPRCVCNASEGFKKHNQLMNLMQFLMGLDDSYMLIRSSILSREVLPDVISAYATISREESHRVALGHLTYPVLNVLKNSLQFDKNLNYEICQRAKHTRYFLTIVDDYTIVVWVYLFKSKDEVSYFITVFYNLIENQFKKKIKVFKSDNGTEFVNQSINKFCADKGIIHQTSCAYTPQQNGIAERKHRHLLNVARSLMFQGRIPLRMWTECILTTTYLINRLPSSVLNGKSPYEMIYKKCPTLSHLRVFGCLCFGTIVNNSDNFGIRSEKCVMIGYSSIPNDDERVDPKQNSDNKSQSASSSSSESGRNSFTVDFLVNSENDADRSDNVFVTQDERVTTLEENIFSKGNLDQNSNSSPHGVQNLRRSSRQSVFPRNYNDFVVDSKVKYGIEKYVGYSKLNTENYCFVTQHNKNHELKSFLEASKYPHWTDAMNHGCLT
ncbi:putative RNA-directed DNA polymerase [Tanacetum coccineum]